MEASQSVADAIYFGLGMAVIIGILWWVTDTAPGATLPRWTQLQRWIMSRYFVIGDQADDDQADDKSQLSDVSRKNETSENSVVMLKDEGSESFLFPDAFMALARLIQASRLTESDALRIGIKAPAGGSTRYKEARRLLTAALQELQPSQYAPLSQEHIDNRRHLDLPIKK
jgi:hypothetical protein